MHPLMYPVNCSVRAQLTKCTEYHFPKHFMVIITDDSIGYRVLGVCKLVHTKEFLYFS